MTTFNKQINNLREILQAAGYEQTRLDQHTYRVGNRLYSVETGYGCMQIQARVFKAKAKRPWDKELLGRFEAGLHHAAGLKLANEVRWAVRDEEARRAA